MANQAVGQQVLGHAANLINSIYIIFSLKKEWVPSVNLKTITDWLDKSGTQYHMQKSSIGTFGMSLWIREKEIHAQLDPNLAGVNFEILDKILSSPFVETSGPIRLNIDFLEGVRSIDAAYKRSAKLFGTPISYVKTESPETKMELSFGEFNFDVYTSSWHRTGDSLAVLHSDYFGKALTQMKLNELLTILFESGILYVNQEFV